jgi:hypothetical protein
MARLRLVTIPTADTAFAAHAETLLAEFPAGVEPPAILEAFQRRLQSRFPGAVVRPREDLADVSAGGEVVWYATNRAYRSRIVATLDVPAAPDLAFEVYVHRVAEWQTAVRLRPRHLTANLVGSEWSASWGVLGRSAGGVFRLVQADPPHAVRFEASGMGIRVWYDTSFSPSRGRTVVRVVGDYDLPDGLLPKVVDRLFVERSIQRQIDQAHDAFVALCDEATGAASAASVPADAGATRTV